MNEYKMISKNEDEVLTLRWKAKRIWEIIDKGRHAVIYDEDGNQVDDREKRGIFNQHHYLPMYDRAFSSSVRGTVDKGRGYRASRWYKDIHHDISMEGLINE